MNPHSGRPHRVLYAHNSADIYGASRSLLRLTTHLDRNRFEPYVVLPADGPLATKLQAQGIEVHVEPRMPLITRSLLRSWRLPLFPLAFLTSTRFFRNLIRRTAADLVHTNTGVIPSPALAACRAQIPHVWHIRDWFQEFRGLWRPYSRYILKHSDRVLAVSEAVAAQFEDRRKVRVLHNGFDLSEFQVPRAECRMAFRGRHALGNDFVVGTVGRIKLRRKGQEVLLDALALLQKRGCPVTGVIVGAPFPGNESHLAELQLRARRLGIQGKVLFTGEIADPREAYSAFDVFVLPSGQPEPFGGVVMEAMALGLPVVATAIGGSVEQVAEGETGFLVPPGNPEALADRLEQLFRDPALRQRMGESGPKRIERSFSLASMVTSIESLYLGLIRG